MRFLADECVDRFAIEAIRDAGHDIELVVAKIPQASDRDVAALAVAEGRILVTEDRDFGKLIFALSSESTGVLYIRWPAQARSTLYETVQKAVEAVGADLASSFVVLTPGRVRIRSGRSSE